MKKNFSKKDKSSRQFTRKNKHGNFERRVELKNEEFLTALVDSKRDPFILILDCIQDPHNLGACLRSADGAGVDAVIIPKDKAASVTPAVVSVSCGAAHSVPIVQVTNLVRTMKSLKENNIWTVGTTDHATQSIYDTDLKGGLAVVLGAEGKGMRRLTEEECDFLVNLPMKGKVDCLNVSVAAGICLYEALRQRENA